MSLTLRMLCMTQWLMMKYYPTDRLERIEAYLIRRMTRDA